MIILSVLGLGSFARFGRIPRSVWLFPMAAALGLTGCGGGNPLTSPTGTAPQIVTQPQSTTIPLDSSATLSVNATGTGPLSYQWSENANALAGASAASLTTPALQMADSGDKFTVTVSNAFGSVTSDVATITIGPRSPDARDLRFKHVQLAASLQPTPCSVGQICLDSVTALFPGGGIGSQYQGVVASPLEAGNSVCSPFSTGEECEWLYETYSPPTDVAGFNVLYTTSALSSINSVIQSIVPNGVMTAVDIQLVAQAFAYSEEVDPTATGGFTVQQLNVTDTTLAAAVSQWASQGIVVTAVTADARSGIDLVGYKWSDAASTTYDAQAVLTSYASAATQGQALSKQGYILTAIGTADANLVLLVGTKVHGDSLPRPFYSTSTQGENIGTRTGGMVVVGFLVGTDGGANPAIASTQIVISQ